jgi:hypothetical protein
MKRPIVTPVAALALPAAAAAAQIGHDHFVSDPHSDSWCGIQGTSVDDVVANYTLDGGRPSLNVRTTFAATVSQKSLEIKDTGVRTASGPVDNADGTYSVTFANKGQSPRFKLPTGEVVQDTGNVIGVATFDSATDVFLDFEVVKQAGPRPNACAEIVGALS